jgi:hypothetical protein
MLLRSDGFIARVYGVNFDSKPAKHSGATLTDDPELLELYHLRSVLKDLYNLETSSKIWAVLWLWWIISDADAWIRSKM